VIDRKDAGFFRPRKHGLSVNEGGLAVPCFSDVPDDRDDFFRPRELGLFSFEGGLTISSSDFSEDRELVLFGALRLF